MRRLYELALILTLLFLMMAAAYGAPTVMWDYPAEPAGDPPTHFNVYRTTDLTQPFELWQQVPYVAGQTNWAVVDDTDAAAAFFKVSAANSAGESFALRKDNQ